MQTKKKLIKSNGAAKHCVVVCIVCGGFSYFQACCRDWHRNQLEERKCEFKKENEK